MPRFRRPSFCILVKKKPTGIRKQGVNEEALTGLFAGSRTKSSKINDDALAKVLVNRVLLPGILPEPDCDCMRDSDVGQ